MTTSPDDIHLFDVVLVPFVFEEDSSKSKVRPAIVVSISGECLLLSLAKVTSHAPRFWCAGEVPLADWREEGLLRPSTVRCSKILRLTTDEVLRILGTLTDEDVLRVEGGLQEASVEFD